MEDPPFITPEAAALHGEPRRAACSKRTPPGGQLPPNSPPGICRTRAAGRASWNKDAAGLRVFVQGGGCSGFQYGLMIEESAGDADSDQIFQSNGVKLFVDPISIRYLSSAEVDFVDNLTGGGFTIKNPNAKTTCGCGQSFGV